MKEYKNNSCNTCEFKSKCTSNKNGRVIFRWEHEKVLEDMRERVKNNPDIIRKRNCMSEHPFGTMKRGFNQGYFLLKGAGESGGRNGSYYAGI